MWNHCLGIGIKLKKKTDSNLWCGEKQQKMMLCGFIPSFDNNLLAEKERQKCGIIAQEISIRLKNRQQHLFVTVTHCRQRSQKISYHYCVLSNSAILHFCTTSMVLK